MTNLVSIHHRRGASRQVIGADGTGGETFVLDSNLDNRLGLEQVEPSPSKDAETHISDVLRMRHRSSYHVKSVFSITQ